MNKVEDHDSRILWISAKPETATDWPVWYLLQLQYLEEYGEQTAKELGKYCVTLSAVSPDAVPAEEKQSAFRCADLDSWFNPETDNRLLCEAFALHDYGTRAVLFERCGNNKTELLREARNELAQLSITIGFKLDRQQNAIGASGWDFLQGDPLGALKNASMKEIVQSAVDRQ